MRVMCAWCKKEMPAIPGPEAAVSHGICPECRAVHFPRTIKVKNQLRGEILVVAHREDDAVTLTIAAQNTYPPVGAIPVRRGESEQIQIAADCKYKPQAGDTRG